MTIEFMVFVLVLVTFVNSITVFYLTSKNKTWEKFVQTSDKLLETQKQKIGLKRDLNVITEFSQNNVKSNRFLIAHDEKLNVLSCVEYIFHVDRNGRLTSKFFILMLENDRLKDVYNSTVFDYEFLSQYCMLVMKDQKLFEKCVYVQQEYITNLYSELQQNLIRQSLR